MKTNFFLLGLMLCFVCDSFAQIELKSISLNKNQDLECVNVITTNEKYLEKNSLKVVGNELSNSPTFVKLNNCNFKNGIIEVEVAGKPKIGSKGFARGFVGIAFRINELKYECIYLRPTNSRCNDQVRRNHSVQYCAEPDFPWDKLRKDSPEKYESYVDLETGEWTKIKIEIKNSEAKLYVHGNIQPTLIVNDLKNGADNQGAIGLWIGPETEAYFANLQITKLE